MNPEAVLVGIKSSIIVGLIYGIGTVGLSLIYKYLKFPDFTTLASISLSAIVVVNITNFTDSIFIGLIAGVFSGVLLGAFTAFQIEKLMIPAILAGIITSIASTTLSFYINGDQAEAIFKDSLRGDLDLWVNNLFTLRSLIVVGSICLFVSCFVGFVLFRGGIGLSIHALNGSDNYLIYRHKKKTIISYILIMFGNGLIGLSGGLVAIQNNNVNVLNAFLDFLVIALGAFSLSIFLIDIINKKGIREYLSKKANLISKFIAFIIGGLVLNEEEPKRILMTMIVVILSAALINVIFKTIEIHFGGANKMDYALKAGVLLLSIYAGHMTQKITSQN